MKSSRLRTGQSSPRPARRDLDLGTLFGNLALEVGLVLAVAAAFVAVAQYFTRPSRTVWNKPLAHWLVALRSPSSQSRDSGLAAIEQLEPTAVRMLALVSPLLDDPNRSIRIRASTILIGLSRTEKDRVAVEQVMLRVLAQGRTGPARAQAAVVLGKIGVDSRGAAALVRAIEDPQEEVRAAAAFVLGEVATRPLPVIMRVLLRASRDPSAEVRAAAMESLHRGWPKHDSVLVVAGVALTDTSAIVREQAIHALADFGARAGRYRPRIVTASHDPDPGIRTTAKRALERMPLIP